MTVIYCVKETREVIGTHYKGWLKLRDENPARFAELNNTGKIELVRIGYDHMRSALAIIDNYGLLDQHKKECWQHMQRAIDDVQKEITAIVDDLTQPISGTSSSILREELEKLINRRNTWIDDLKRGALRLSSCEDD